MNANHQKITSTNLAEYSGKPAELYCQVGVVLSITGKLEVGCGLCQYGVRMSNDQTVGFSYGDFKVLPNGTISIRVY